MTDALRYQNRVMLTGVLETSVATRTRPGGHRISHLTLATIERWQQGATVREHKELHRIVLHDHVAEIAATQLNAGDWVTIEGHIRARAWTDQHNRTRKTTEIIGHTLVKHGRNETKRTRLANPCAGVRRHKERPAKGRITDEMYLAVHQYGDQILQDWMDLTVTCGQRVSDVLKIKRTDIYAERGRRYLDARQGKTEHEFRIEIQGDLAIVIDRLLNRKRQVAGAYLIQTDQGRPVSYTMIRKRFDEAKARARAAAEREGLHWRDFKRKDLRSKSAQDAATVEEAQERLGHTDARITRRHYRRGTVAKGGRLPVAKKDVEEVK